MISETDLAKAKWFIKGWEGFSARVYRCPAGLRTQGYGHALMYGEDFGEKITEAEADCILGLDIRRIQRQLDNVIGVPITEGQAVAITSLVFNVGVGAFARSKLLKKLNGGDIEGAAEEFLDWDYCNGKKLPGLTKRRKAEHDLFIGEDFYL